MSKKILNARELLEKLSEKLELYEKGEATLDDLSALSKVSDSMCKIVKTSIEVRREVNRLGADEFPVLNFLEQKQLPQKINSQEQEF